jgi:CDP-diacylglycerol--serine O-phosphatidyltransferase
MKKRKRREDGISRGVYVLPNLITSCSLFAGFYSIAATYTGQFEKAAMAIIAAVVLDGLDGRIARMTQTTTKFGVEYDSLVDVVACGVAPAFLVYGWALSRFGRWGWLAAFLYLICGALRLARFNVQVNTVERGKFNGLPIPAAATFVASMIVLFYYLGGSGSYKHVAVLLSIYVLAFLMVSTVGYDSFKDLEPLRRRPFNTLVVFIFLALLLVAEPQVMIFLFSSVYIVSGPVGELVRALRGRRRQEITDESEKTAHGNDADGEDPREARGEGKG